MMKLQYIFASFALAAALTACNADMDVDIADPVLPKPDVTSMQASLDGDNYVITWPSSSYQMQVSRYVHSTKVSTIVAEGLTYTHQDVETNVPYTYVLKYTDGTNYSEGAVLSYTRPGASKCTGVTMSQVEVSSGVYNAVITWDANSSATTGITLAANNGTKESQFAVKLPAGTTTYTIEDVKEGDTWYVTLVAENAEGTSLPVLSSLRIGKLAVGFLSTFHTETQLYNEGDDDEVCAWLWFHETYPNGAFIPFDRIGEGTLEPYRVLWWMRDIDDGSSVWEMPERVVQGTPYIREWYKNGGSLLLWGHATPYIGTLGRIDMEMLKGNDNSINTEAGGWNGDVWKMACKLNCGTFTKDYSTHAVFKGLEVEDNGTTKLIAFKGPGWTEDHNCLYFNIPSALTGKGNQDEASLTMLENKFGIYPLGTWDSQISWVSQLNVWEAQQGNTEFQGTIICVGNGGLNFSMKNADGTPDLSAYPSNNIYQDNILKFAKNCIEYLKTR